MGPGTGTGAGRGGPRPRRKGRAEEAGTRRFAALGSPPALRQRPPRPGARAPAAEPPRRPPRSRRCGTAHGGRGRGAPPSFHCRRSLAPCLQLCRLETGWLASPGAGLPASLPGRERRCGSRRGGLAAEPAVVSSVCNVCSRLRLPPPPSPEVAFVISSLYVYRGWRF